MADASRGEPPAAARGPAIARAVGEQPPLKVREKAVFAAGDMVDGVVAWAVASYLFYYLTADCGLSGTLASLTLAISVVIDAVVDPQIGFISHNTRSRCGRRHPYMVFAAFPTSIAL